jgi:hypothetical protein
LANVEYYYHNFLTCFTNHAGISRCTRTHIAVDIICTCWGEHTGNTTTFVYIWNIQYTNMVIWNIQYMNMVIWNIQYMNMVISNIQYMNTVQVYARDMNIWHHIAITVYKLFRFMYTYFVEIKGINLFFKLNKRYCSSRTICTYKLLA